MKIVQEQPKIIDQARRVFRLPQGAIFTMGDVIYNPSGNLIDLPTMRHEEIHSRQQGNYPEKWWQRYFNDKDFRKGQELEAYRTQYKEAKKLIKDRNALFRYVLKLAHDFSSDMYGLNISKDEALRLIRG